ncbi:MAG: SpoIID/LytB domain-containing protein [Phycisphaeraceae bacterium]|nr:SpoIID/LytB domain-containing protein [Phycisphaeraceae bacterium]
MDFARTLLMSLERRPNTVIAVGSVILGASSLMLGITLTSCDASRSSYRSTRIADPVTRPTPAAPDAVGNVFAVAGIKGEPEMRIRILESAPRATFSGVDSIWLGPVIGSGSAGAAERTRGAYFTPPVEVVLAADSWVVRDNAGQERRLPARGAQARELEVEGVMRDNKPASTAVNGQRFAGRFRLAPAAARRPTADVSQPAPVTLPSSFDVIEYIPMEEYLPGVLAKELPKDWNLAACMVQAVCARSYAIHERNRSAATGRAFDVEASTRDQAYAGATTLPNAIDAVAQTRGIILTTDGAVLRAYYSSTCGGRTAAARDTWPTSKGFEFNLVPPLQAYERAHYCQASPLYTWTVERPKDELVRRFAVFGERNNYLIRQIRDLAKIEVVRTNATGRPAEYKIIEPGGKSYILKGEELRLACNTEEPPIAGVSAGLPPITRATRVNSSDFEVVVEGSTVVFSGRGFGHGVGMCQYCTNAMSKRGTDWQDMLHAFYPGARVVKAY